VSRILEKKNKFAQKMKENIWVFYFRLIYFNFEY